MFLENSRRSCTRDGQQRASGLFLLVFSHNQYKWADETGKHWKEFPAELNRRLYAYVTRVAMEQCGHWMMGKARVGNQWITVSGTYGSDGLPCDYEKVEPKYRAKLVEVPADLAEKFWKGGGHNSAGSEGPAMREWAIATFRK